MNKTKILLTAPVAVAAMVGGLVAAAPAANGAGSDNVTHVANFPFEDVHGYGENAGTDIEFTTITDADGVERTYALSGSYYNGLIIHDVTDGENVTHVGTYDCSVAQGDVQTFKRTDDAGVERTFAVFTRDDGYGIGMESECAVWAQENAEDAYIQSGGHGSWIADISDPADPHTVAFIPFEKGSHNITVHPSGNYLYNSNSDLLDFVTPAIEITDITDFSNPVRLAPLALQGRPGLGSDSHDITFNSDGSRAYSAAIGQTSIIDSSDPENPVVLATLEDPAVNVEHEAEVVSVNDPLLGDRDFLIVEDEFAGATGTGQCPNGGVHVYDVTGDLELAPVKVGFWNLRLEESGPTRDGALGRCTAHVFDVHPEEQIMTIAYYNGGVRVVDFSAMVGVALGAVGQGMKEIGWYRFDDQDAWSVKAPAVSRDGVWYMYSGDQARGMDVFKVDLTGGAEQFSTPNGEWLSPDEALGRALLNPVDLTTYTPNCLLGDQFGQDA